MINKDLLEILKNAEYFYKIMSHRMTKATPIKTEKFIQYANIEVSSLDLGFCNQELKKIKNYLTENKEENKNDQINI